MTDGCEVIADLNGHEHPILSGMSCFLCVNMPNIISQCIYCHTITVTSLRAQQNWRNPLCNMNVSDTLFIKSENTQERDLIQEDHVKKVYFSLIFLYSTKS